MLNLRFREKTNAWPGFVDLFSNLVIILIFLLIVFVFLWTATSVFDKDTGSKKVADLEQARQEQAEQIVQMTANLEEAEQLLLASRTAMENQAAIINEQVEQQKNIADAYEKQITDLNSSQQKLAEQIAELTDLLRVKEEEKEEAVQAQRIAEQEAQLAEQQMQEAQEQQLNFAAQEEETRKEIFDQANYEINTLNEQIATLQEALARSEELARKQEVEYIEMSNQLNKALAEKVAELNALSQYQSEFYKQVKNALGERTTIKPDGDRFIVSSDILFPTGSYTVSKSGKSQLKLLANVIKDFENKIPTDIDWIIRVDGHTDNRPVRNGTKGYSNNMQLSLLRATAVVNELVKNGVSKRRLVPSGFGELHPVELGGTPEKLKKNRRIELQLTNK